MQESDRSGCAVSPAEETPLRAPDENVKQSASVPPAVKKKPLHMNPERSCEDDQQLDEVEEVDQLLAEQHKMQCPDWERAQIADPVIRHMRELMEEFSKVAPNEVQLRSELAGVKHL